MIKTNSHNRNGITLVEIILSIVVLAGSMAVLANLSRMGMRNAITSKEMTQAQFLCESLLAELETGILDLEPAYDEPVRDFPDTGASNPYDSNEVLWVYDIDISTIHDNGLLEVIVTVKKDDKTKTQSKPISYRLVRWMIDKDVVAEVLAERESDSSSDNSENSNSSGSSTQQGGISR